MVVTNHESRIKFVGIEGLHKDFKSMTYTEIGFPVGLAFYWLLISNNSPQNFEMVDQKRTSLLPTVAFESSD